MTGLIILGLIVFVILAVAWYDGGREEQRLIVQPVELPAGAHLPGRAS
ncbi:hypothetical protein [Aurantiacibacter spongiae]|nr:hypothetical protein [Aurantiacibacter spongiae]